MKFNSEIKKTIIIIVMEIIFKALYLTNNKSFNIIKRM